MVSPETKPRVIVIQGPTAVGKSSLALELAAKFGGQIISADSLQVYRYLDIGTAKPTWAERQKVVHHLIDILMPDEPFHAGAYAEIAGKVIERLHEEGIPIFVVGGTGLYIRALLGGLCQAPPADEKIRQRLLMEAELLGLPRLYERLQRLDPLSAGRINPRDRQRIIRALEVYEGSGRALGQEQQAHGFGARRFTYFKIGIHLERAELYRRIEERVETMLDRGLIAEVEATVARGYGPQLKPLQAIGYRHILNYLAGNWRLAEAVDFMKRDTRHYAKRQLTWFKRDPEITWFRPEERQDLESRIRGFLAAGGTRGGEIALT